MTIVSLVRHSNNPDQVSVLLTFLQTKARLLKNPEVLFEKATINPGYNGRWDLRGKKFYTANPTELKSWGVCILGGVVDEPTASNFLKVLVQTYVCVNALLLSETD
jgi:hypothetical protein